MYLHRHYHINFKHYFKTALSKLEFSVWLHTFGRSLVSIFIPILLLQIGFSLSNVILFFLIYNAIDVPLNLFARNLIIKRGAREVIFIGILFQIIGFFILYFGSFSFALLLALAFVLASYDSFYWVAHWFVFNECVKSKKKAGRRVGGLMIVRKLASLISPLIGAGFLIFLNKNYLLIVSVLFLFLSLIPLFKLKLTYVIPKKKMSFKKFFDYKRNRRDYFYVFMSHFHGAAEGVLLPLFVFITFGRIESVGALPVIATIASIVFVFYVGKWSDKFNTNGLIFIGALLVGLFWILRIVFPIMNIIYLTTLLIGFFGVLVGVPIDSNLVRNGKKTSMIGVSCYRNIFHMLSGFVFYLILFFAIEIFKLSFIISALSMFMITLASGIVLRFRLNKKLLLE
jgi:MFS family permease